jgi:hypothetical protein
MRAGMGIFVAINPGAGERLYALSHGFWASREGEREEIIKITKISLFIMQVV